MLRRLLFEEGTIVAKRFRLDHRLGEGGMGVVWSATHTVTGRRHALKLLKVPSPAFQQRLIREARAASAVDHPHVMRIEDVFELEDGGMPVLVLELLEGESLQTKLSRVGRMSVSDTADVLLPVVSAVGAAHEAGVIHRDLKPDNIFLGDTGVKVLDFGIARLQLSAELAAGDGALTKTGALVGTPFYMSPEQATGEAIDHRTDIWSLGIVAYQLLTGVLPTKADTVGAALKIVMTGRIPPLSSHDIEIEEDVAELIGQMLALEPADRPADLRLVRDALVAHSDRDVPDFGAPAGTVALASLPHADVDMETGEWLAERTSDPPSASAEVTSEGEPAAAIENTDGRTSDGELTKDAQTRSAVSASDGEVPGAGGTTTAATVTALAASSGSVSSPSRPGWLMPVGVGAVVVGAGFFYLTGQRRTPPIPAETRSHATVSESPKPPPPVLREPKLGLDAIAKYRSHLKQQGAVLSSSSWWTTAAEDFRTAAEQPNAPARWKAAEHFATGHVFIRSGKQDQAIAAFEKAIALEPEWAEPYAGLSSAFLAKAQFDKSLAAAQKAQRVDPKWWRGVVCGARVLNKQKQITEAIQEYRRALSLVPDSALVLSELALTYHAARLDSEASRHGEMALAIDPDMAAVRLMFAERALEKNDAKEALEQATRAVAISPRDVGGRLALGDALAIGGKKQEALAAYQAMLALLVDGKAPLGAPQQRIALVARLVPLGKLPPPRVSKVQRQLPSRSIKSKELPMPPAPPPRTNSRTSAMSVEEAYD